MAGIASSTIYEVITRYHVQDLGATNLGKYERATMRAHRSNLAMGGGIRRTARGFRMLSMAIAPMIGGAVGLASIGYATAKGFKNLNEELNNSIQLAGQLNLAFRFSEDPAENFLKSMKVSKSVFREMVSDAAKLPGELSDFLGIGRAIGLPAFTAGATTGQYRELIAKLALVTPMAGGKFDAVGLGAMQMLQGTARITNPLFAMMKAGNLLGADIGTTGDFNELQLVERLARLDAGLSRLVDNEMFRSAVLDTFDTQLGTLADNLFGISGIAGELGADAFDGLLEGLTGLNRWLEENQAGIVEKARLFVGAGALTGLDRDALQAFIGTMPSAEGPWAAKEPKWWDISGVWARQQYRAAEGEAIYQRAQRIKAEAMQERGLFAGDRLTTAERREFDVIFRSAISEGPEALREAREAHRRAQEEAPPEGERAEAPQVNQTFNITMNVSTDESPEATAVRMRRVIAEATDHPTVTGEFNVLLNPAVAGP